MTDVTTLQPGFRFLLEAAHRAPSADNTQPWRLQVTGDRLALRYDDARGHAALTGPERHITLLSMGAVVENLVQAAAAAGIALEPVESDSASKLATYFDVRLLTPQMAVPDALTSHPIFQRHTNRHPYRADPLPADLLGALGTLHEGGARVVAVTDRAKIRDLAAGVRVASEARFKTRELHDWLMGCLRSSPAEVARGDGLDVRTLHLPPGGGLLLRSLADWRRMSAFNRIGGYRMLAGIEAGLLGKGPALLAVAGPQGRTDVLNAGKVMERAWLLLTERGIAAHPYYVLPDQLQRLARGDALPEFSAKIAEVAGWGRETLCLGSDETLHMLLRVGYPKVTPVRSLRLPLERVLEVG